MVPPCFVKQARVVNKSQNNVLVQVTFGLKDLEDSGFSLVKVENAVMPSEYTLFTEQHADFGSWCGNLPIREISIIAVDNKSLSNSIVHVVQVDQIYDEREFTIKNDPDSQVLSITMNSGH